MARTVAIGEQDFKELAENHCFYVDKTYFIKEWWENRDKVTLITRPRRFGKTLTMSMIDYFFSLEHAGRGDLFEGLFIWREETYRRLQGTYPVIFLSFAGIKGNNYKETCRKIGKLITREYRRHAFLTESEHLLKAERKEFLQVIDNGVEEGDLEFSINQLSEYLYKHYQKRVIILLDEYDTPMHEAYVSGYWDGLTRFMQGLLNATFKTNPYLERAIMTGVTRVSKESIFSDLNNLEVVSIISEKYETSFGFTEEETCKALEEFGLESKKADVKRWYDGFRFGKCDSIYNPWSITKFLEHKQLEPYWANTSSNKLAGSLIQNGSSGIKTVMEDLFLGKTFQTAVNEEIVFDDLDYNGGAIWSLLLASGYLKVVSRGAGRKDYVLALTNLEVKTVFEDMFIGWFADQRAEYNNFEKALLSDNLKEMNIYINKVSTYTFSCFDTGKKPSESAEPERFYHGFVLGLMAQLRDRYEITSNRESGYGKYDVMLSPVNNKDDGIILEFKVIDPDEERSLQDTANAALRQIINKKYAAMLESKGIDPKKIRIYGFAFQGQKVLIDGGNILDCMLS